MSYLLRIWRRTELDTISLARYSLASRLVHEHPRRRMPAEESRLASIQQIWQYFVRDKEITRVKKDSKAPLFWGEWQGNQEGNVQKVESTWMASKIAAITRQRP